MELELEHNENYGEQNRTEQNRLDGCHVDRRYAYANVSVRMCLKEERVGCCAEVRGIAVVHVSDCV